MKTKQIFTSAFWLIMAVHFIVFVITGFVSGDWRLILIFLPLLALTVTVKYIISFYRKK